MTGVRITDLGPDADGIFTARLSAGDVTVRADNSLGSWTYPLDPTDAAGDRHVARRELRPDIARQLQDRLRAYLRAEGHAEAQR